MPKLMRALVLGAMLAVLSSATAAVAQPPAPSDQAVQQFRAGERAPLGQPVSHDQAVQRFRAGERGSQAQPTTVSNQAAASNQATVGIQEDPLFLLQQGQSLFLQLWFLR